MDGITMFTILYIALAVYICNVYALFYHHGIAARKYIN